MRVLSVLLPPYPNQHPTRLPRLKIKLDKHCYSSMSERSELRRIQSLSSFIFTVSQEDVLLAYGGMMTKYLLGSNHGWRLAGLLPILRETVIRFRKSGADQTTGPAKLGVLVFSIISKR